MGEDFVRLEFTYEPDDFEQMAKVIRKQFAPAKKPKHTSLSTREFSILWLAIPAAVAGFFWLKLESPAQPRSIGSNNSTGEGFPLLIVFVFALIALVSVILLIALVRFQVRIQFARNTSLGEPQVAQLDEDGISITGPTSSTLWLWKGFLNWNETETVFLLQQSPKFYVIIPKRAAADALQLAVTRLLIGSHVNKMESIA
jgi:hypothetical protein